MSEGDAGEVHVTAEMRSRVLRAALANKVVTVKGLTFQQKRALESAKAGQSHPNPSR